MLQNMKLILRTCDWIVLFEHNLFLKVTVDLYQVENGFYVGF